MATYKAYPEYKTTGLGWLTEIPVHWNVKKLKFLGQAIIGLTYSPDDVVDEGEGTLVLRSSNIQNGKLDFLDNVFVNKTIPLQLKTKENDILICARNGSRTLIGKNVKITKGAEGMTFGAFMSIFRSCYNNYLSHVFGSALFEYQSGSFLTATINQLTTSNLNSFEIPLPPESEQNRIVSFLDHETAKIDNLIEKQQQLIELLKEKRQAAISNAVTKGLNPNVQMKDSGMEFQQKRPLHWTFNKLRYMFNFDKGLTITKENIQDEGIPCINYGEIHSKYHFEIDTKIHKLKCVNKSYLKNNKNSLLYKGDIIFADTSEDIEGAGNFSQLVSSDIVFAGYHTIIARLNNRENSRFYAYLLNSQELRAQIRYSVKGVKVYSITQAILRNISCWLPSSDEQNHIAKYLDQKITKIDTLIDKQRQQIALLQERRTALISAAVTGKIDVRNWHAPNEQTIVEAEVAV